MQDLCFLMGRLCLNLILSSYGYAVVMLAILEVKLKKRVMMILMLAVNGCESML